jgi:hypothetical protein
VEDWMRAFDLDRFHLDLDADDRYRESRVAGESLCTGCKHAHRYRRRGSPDPAIFCHTLDRYVPPDIVECSEYRAVAALSLTEMREIALPVDPRPGIHDGSYR